MSVLVIIPARLNSVRLPNKLLKDLGGMPVLQHTWNQVSQMKYPYRLLIATDSEEIKQAAESWGAEVVMTSSDCESGTARIISILDQVEEDFIINVQGDYPFINPRALDEMCECWENSKCDLVTLVTKIQDENTLFNPDCVKVVKSDNGNAIYFSRSPIPYCRDRDEKEWLSAFTYWRHVGMYGYTKKALKDYESAEPYALECVEKLEQLRFLNLGCSFQTIEVESESLSIETESDLYQANKILMDA